MPCRTYPDEFPNLSSDIKKKSLERQIRGLESLLYSTCRVLEAEGYDFGLNPVLDQWWSEHKKEDVNRQVKELQAKLLKEEAMEIAKKPFIELTTEDRKKLRDQGLMG